MSDALLNKAVKSCAKRETCTYDMSIKLRQWGASSAQISEILQYLIEQNYIDNARYARAFAHDKFYFNKWGKRKIYYSLKQKKIPETFIQQALNEIDTADYFSTLEKILQNKLKSLPDHSNSIRQKLYNFAISKGYEIELIYRVLNEILKN